MDSLVHGELLAHYLLYFVG